MIVSRTRRECARLVRKKGILIQIKVCSYVISISFSFTVSVMISRIHGAGVRYLLSYTIIALSAIANPIERKSYLVAQPGRSGSSGPLDDVQAVDLAFPFL